MLVSSGTMLMVLGINDGAVSSGALLYMVSSTLTLAAFFMLIELVERGQDAGAAVLAVTMEAYGEGEESELEQAEGVAMPGTMALLGHLLCRLRHPAGGAAAAFRLCRKVRHAVPMMGTGTIGIPPTAACGRWQP